MKLIDILVRELPKRGGWPEGYYRCAQNIYGEVIFEALPEGFQVSATTIFTFGSLAEDFADEEVTREQYEAALKQPVWDGTGLPPVGVECERSWCGDKWLPCTVLFVSDETVVVKLATREAAYGVNEVKFRPIRTEREEAIHEIASMIGRGTFYEDAERIYDAGYRKLSD